MNTIRSRLIFIAIICLIFAPISLILYCENIFDLKAKVILIERFDDLRNNLLELRRHEKNYFLAKDFSSLDKMMIYLSKTEEAFNELGDQIQNIMGKEHYKAYLSSLNSYKKILNENIDGLQQKTDGTKDHSLRLYGKQLNDLTDRLILAKRKRIDRNLNHIMIIPIMLSTISVLLLVVFFWIVRKNILDPLAKLQTATENITKGIFSPVKVSEDRSDEVSKCLMAFNTMAYEIETGQEQLLQSRKMASIGTFTSGIAHELNNPINNISLIVDGLLEDDSAMTNEERRSLYNDLMTQADRSSDIVKNLLEFSRTEQKSLEKISLETLIDKTARLVKNELQLNKIQFSKRVTGKLPDAVWIDRHRLQQALLNLFLNAIQAMPDGGSLSVMLATGNNAGEVRIDVSDTGIGLSADQIDVIFDPFFTSKKEGEGTGLGLSVTYGIINKHGGRITVESEPGKGSCFSIFLPVGGKSSE